MVHQFGIQAVTLCQEYWLIALWSETYFYESNSSRQLKTQADACNGSCREKNQGSAIQFRVGMGVELSSVKSSSLMQLTVPKAGPDVAHETLMRDASVIYLEWLCGPWLGKGGVVGVFTLPPLAVDAVKTFCGELPFTNTHLSWVVDLWQCIWWSDDFVEAQLFEHSFRLAITIDQRPEYELTVKLQLQHFLQIC